MARYAFEPSTVGDQISKVEDIPTRNALAVVAAMVFQSQSPDRGLTEVTQLFNSAGVDVGKLSVGVHQ
jgi:uncharacterized protein YwlG (UPF0340 family)